MWVRKVLHPRTEENRTTLASYAAKKVTEKSEKQTRTITCPPRCPLYLDEDKMLPPGLKHPGGYDKYTPQKKAEGFPSLTPSATPWGPTPPKNQTAPPPRLKLSRSYQGWKIRLPSDRIIRIFAHQNSLKLSQISGIFSQFLRNSEKIRTSQHFLECSAKSRGTIHQDWYNIRWQMSKIDVFKRGIRKTDYIF